MEWPDRQMMLWTDCSQEHPGSRRCYLPQEVGEHFLRVVQVPESAWRDGSMAGKPALRRAVQGLAAEVKRCRAEWRPAFDVQWAVVVLECFGAAVKYGLRVYWKR